MSSFGWYFSMYKPWLSLHSALYETQAAEGIPLFAIPEVLSLLEVEDIVRCASIAKPWASSVLQEPIASKVIYIL